MSILDITKTLMYKFWYDYIKLNYVDRVKLCYTDTDSIIAHIMSEYFYRDIADDVQKWFDTSNCDENGKRPLPISENKKVYSLFKDELGGKIMKEFFALRAKAYAYLTDDESENKKAKGTKKCVRNCELMFKNYNNCLFNGKVILKSQQWFKSDHHKVYTEEINKIAWSSDDDKRLQTFDGIKTNPYRTNVFKLCETEVMAVLFVENYVDFPFYGETVLNNKDKCFQRINDQFWWLC